MMSGFAARLAQHRTHRSAHRRGLLVGAAIGTGMAAKAAVRGGTDLLLALNAGRLRSMGAPSVASLLPLRDSNAWVMDFGCAEILPACADVPVFFGASAFDPRRCLADLIGEIAAAGFHGVANFPTCIFLSGKVRDALEAAGVGFRRELELLQRAREEGLMTLAFVHSQSEARMMTAIGVDAINLNFGWNHGGRQGVRPQLSLAEAAEYARQTFRRIRRINPRILCMVEGGPIVGPTDMYHVCQVARADGYIGGSTIDRVPLETSVEEVTAAFKAVSVIQKNIDELERQIERAQRNYGIIGCSPAIQRVQTQIGRIARHGRPVLIIGAAGSGKEHVARAACAASGRPPGCFVALSCDEHAEASLFGAPGGAGASYSRRGVLEAASGQAVFLEDLSALSLRVQGRLVHVIEGQRNARSAVPAARRGRDTQLICALSKSPEALVSEGRLDPRLPLLFHGRRIVLPPLQERLEDVPLLANYMLRGFRATLGSRATGLDHSAYRVLMSHNWPGNVRELCATLEHAVRSTTEVVLTARHIVLTRDDAAATSHPPEHDQKAWILDALRRHRFRRGETARYLGISRKTLYNKMRLLRLDVSGKS